MSFVNVNFYKENPDAILIDCRFNLTQPDEGREEYEKGHVKGAIYVDLDRDLMGTLAEHGGRHPLPDMEEFRKRAESWGISDDSTVIIYDAGVSFPSACRLCLMLKMLGKESYIIEGGIEALREAGYEMVTEVPEPKPGKLTTKPNHDLVVDIDYVLKNIGSEKVAIVDSRGESRYKGLEEPMDKIAGHIPSAIHMFWQDAFDGEKLKSKEELKKRFAPLDAYEEAVFYCGSGVTGAVNTILYESLGGKAKLYSGSYSDYVTYKGNKLIIKDGEEFTIE
ncbi:MAG: sulfurtransferase [Bacillota bacterium]|nr:sulfurtransferase [Bacillota bacterium]